MKSIKFEIIFSKSDTGFLYGLDSVAAKGTYIIFVSKLYTIKISLIEPSVQLFGPTDPTKWLPLE